MSQGLKHWVDIAAAILTALGTAAAPVVTFLASLGAAVWYGIRIYDWYKEKQHGNQ